MKWSVLDQSPSSAGSTQDVAIRETIALAQHCDAMGYERYWVSEHHNSASIVGTAPEILISAVAATTRRIRVGSAGVEEALLESPEHAAAYPYSDAERTMIDKLRAKALVGGASQVADKLHGLARAT